VKGEVFDYFHDLIITQEMVRAHARGFQDGNLAEMTICLTADFNLPIMRLGRIRSPRKCFRTRRRYV
jgi:hypothetical protein